ncbi:HAD family hydrolase [Tritonibacter horizontis]|uniref:6-phosphogluconate phosphatase n=1 Tax=Tritonibacter horizontis TaxID=1768241 RepID=A0A132C068_9RHOB|nr:HAD family phosphatase [Tritonibacter horizontis]KUP93722.1 6-phosphogluconate phosphatase [Tritonibacter horizontis]
MPKTYPRPELVIFDCDGVLVDSERVFNAVLAEDLSSRGLALTTEVSMTTFAGLAMPEVATRARAMGATLPQNWIAEVYDTAYATLRRGVPLVPGVMDVIARLDQEGIPSCVVSNGSEEKMQITLGPHGLWDRYHAGAMFSAHTLKVAKPDPGIFLAAATHFNVQARACVVIEDSNTGARGAARAGMQCFGYAAHDDGAALAAEGAEVFHHMAELPHRLGLG